MIEPIVDRGEVQLWIPRESHQNPTTDRGLEWDTSHSNGEIRYISLRNTYNFSSHWICMAKSQRLLMLRRCRDTSTTTAWIVPRIRCHSCDLDRLLLSVVKNGRKKKQFVTMYLELSHPCWCPRYFLWTSRHGMMADSLGLVLDLHFFLGEARNWMICSFRTPPLYESLYPCRRGTTTALNHSPILDRLLRLFHWLRKGSCCRIASHHFAVPLTSYSIVWDPPFN